MELEASIADLAAKLREHREILQTEEAAKTTLVLPFLRALGYDIFNPAEVKAEFTCDVGTKKGEKVDYAISIGGEIQMLVECKPVTSELSLKHASQLYRYFAATTTRIALLTNGVIYQFYTDADRTNMMDDKPFFVFNLEQYRKGDLKNLAAFARQEFNLDNIVLQASSLKLQSLVLAQLRKEFASPSDEFVKLIAGNLHEGRFTEQVRTRFHGAITQAIGAIIRDGVTERLESAIRGEEPVEEQAEAVDPNAIVTTQVEIDGFNIVRAIGSKVVAPDRIVMRDAKSYCAILLDNNNRKTIARLHFNSPTSRHFGICAGKNDETRHIVTGPVDIYQHSDAIIARIAELAGSAA